MPLPDVITPNDYVLNADNLHEFNPKLREEMHCLFVSTLKEQADREGWLVRLIPEGIPGSGFPEVCLIPPGQEKKSVLHSFRVDAGVPEFLSKGDLEQKTVDRVIRFAGLTQRAFAGPVEPHLPGILSSFPIGTFTRNGKGSYNPVDWAQTSMKMAIALWEHRETLKIFV